MWWISVCLCVCSDVNVPVCAGMSLCASVFFFPQQGQKYFDHYAEALIYHCSNVSCITDFLLAITAFLLHRLPVFPSSCLARIKNATRSVQKWNCAHLPEDNTVLISHSGSPCRFMSGLVSYACFNSDNHMNNAWCLLCVCCHVTHVLYHVCMSTRETTATVFVPRSVLFLFIHK